MGALLAYAMAYYGAPALLAIYANWDWFTSMLDMGLTALDILLRWFGW